MKDENFEQEKLAKLVKVNDLDSGQKEDDEKRQKSQERFSLRDTIRNIFVFSSLILMIILIVLSVVIFKNISRNFVKEREVYSKLFEGVVNLYSEKIKLLCEVYSQWDEMYDYVLSNDKKFEEKYLNLEYFRKFGVEFIGVYSKDNPIFIASKDQMLSSVLYKFDVSNLTKKRSGLHFFQMEENLQFPIEIFVYPIVKSGDYSRSNSVGYLVLGRYFDIKELLDLEKITSSNVTFEAKTSDKREIKAIAGLLFYKKPLINRNGEIIGYIQSHRISETFRSVMINLIVLLTITPLSFFVIVAIAAPFIAKQVIQPLHDIEYAILNHTPDSLERYVYLKNEIGELAQAIKSYLNQKEQINLYLKELESKNASLRALNEEVRRLLEKDPLTGLLTRRVFNEQIERLYVSSKADRIPLSAISIDADNFKKVNDTYGHATGDEVLKTVGEVILKNVRLSDFPIRMGGEEILILLPQADVNAAYSIAERIRKKVEETFENKPYKVTISLGVTQLKGEDSIETFLRRVDDALYISKSNGKNRTTIL